MLDSFFILRIPAILFCLTIHEYAHGWMARRLGDPTAALSGRLTLNPISHLDVFGTIMLMFGPFGWAKPVPVDPFNFNDPKKDMMKVALAGPGINIIAALVIGLLIRLLELMPAMPLAREIMALLLVTMSMWTTAHFSFSILLGCLIKASVTKYGGARLYRSLRPFFLGLTLGAFTSAGLWLIIDFFGGMSGNAFTVG